MNTALHSPLIFVAGGMFLAVLSLLFAFGGDSDGKIVRRSTRLRERLSAVTVGVDLQLRREFGDKSALDRLVRRLTPQPRAIAPAPRPHRPEDRPWQLWRGLLRGRGGGGHRRDGMSRHAAAGASDRAPRRAVAAASGDRLFGQAPREEVHQPAARGDRPHGAQHQIGPAHHRVVPDHRARDSRPRRRRIPPDLRSDPHRPAGRSGAVGYGAPDRRARDEVPGRHPWRCSARPAAISPRRWRTSTTILRRRRQMRLKVKALSSEARASAMIIGALPFLMMARAVGRGCGISVGAVHRASRQPSARRRRRQHDHRSARHGENGAVRHMNVIWSLWAGLQGEAGARDSRRTCRPGDDRGAGTGAAAREFDGLARAQPPATACASARRPRAGAPAHRQSAQCADGPAAHGDGAPQALDRRGGATHRRAAGASRLARARRAHHLHGAARRHARALSASSLSSRSPRTRCR